MKKLKLYLMLGFLFTSVLGSLAHFFYQWSNQNIIVGLFTPINESTWEHMKLLFFPALLWAYFMHQKFKSEFPRILCNILTGVLVGTWAIPIIFYLYTGLLGFHLLALDIGTFIVSVAIAFYTAYRQAVSLDKHKYYCESVYVCTTIMALSFWIYTIIQLG